MNTLSGNGLTIGQPLRPNYQMTIRQGDGGSPYTAPPKEDPNRKYVPAPKRRDLANARLPFINIDNLEDPVGTLRDSGYGDQNLINQN